MSQPSFYFTLTVLLVTFCAYQSFAEKQEDNDTDIFYSHGDDPDPTSFNFSMAPKTTKMPVTIQVNSNIPNVLIFKMETTQEVTMNFTVECNSPTDVFLIHAVSTTPSVASIISSASLNITCASAFADENDVVNTDIEKPVVEDSGITGTFNITFRAHTIGRSRLLFFNENSKNNKDVFYSHKPQKVKLREAEKKPFNNSVTDNDSVVTDIKTKGVSNNGFKQTPVGNAVIIVMRPPQLINHVFSIVIYIAVISTTIGMGVSLDLQVVKAVMKKPVGPCIGLGCQYIFMPLIGYTVAKAVPQPSTAVAFGIFTCGICPGGGTSNMYAYLLGGDLSLSVTMTALSFIAALGGIPLWMFTLGETFKDDTVELHVPFTKILESLAVIIVPLLFGIFVKLKLPRVANIISKVLKPWVIVVVITLFSVGIYANLFVFRMITPITILAGALLPYVGYLVGGLMALILCQSWTRVKTIAIETGMQNVTIAIMMVTSSLPPPDNQLAMVSPAASAIMTPIPLLLITIFYTIYKRYKNKKRSDEEIDENHENEMEKDDRKKDLGSQAGVRKQNWWEKLTLSKPQPTTADVLSVEYDVQAPEAAALVNNVPKRNPPTEIN